VDTIQTKTKDYPMWVDTAAGAIRAAFGLAWAFDAYLKWQPGFYNNYLSYITGIVDGQPHWLVPWFNFWVNLIKPNPGLFAWGTRIVETTIAAGLLLGLARKYLYLLGGVFALLIWSVPEGFGGPYASGATDVGAGLIYAFLFLALIVMDYVLGRSPYSLDYYLEKISPSWRFIAEWAPPQTLAKEPRYLSWAVQSLIILGLVVMLVVFLIIVQSEINTGSSAQSSIIQTMPVAVLYHLQI
jgi:nitrite reductase (NO-forming)